jgi:hypothetical protein
MSLSQMKIARSVDFAMMRKVMDLQRQTAEQMIDAAQVIDAGAVAAPPSAHVLDVLV